MSVHEISLAIYYDLERSGALSRLRLLVAKDIAEHPNTTPAESWKRLSHGKPQRYKDSYSPCFPWLNRAGVIEESGARVCAVAEKMCSTWRLTGQMPKAFEKPLTKAEKERAECLLIAMNVEAEAQTAYGKRAAKEIADRIRNRAVRK